MMWATKEGCLERRLRLQLELLFTVPNNRNTDSFPVPCLWPVGRINVMFGKEVGESPHRDSFSPGHACEWRRPHCAAVTIAMIYDDLNGVIMN